MEAFLPVIISIVASAAILVWISTVIKADGDPFGVAIKVVLLLGAFSILILNSSVPSHFLIVENSTVCENLYVNESLISSNYSTICRPDAGALENLRDSVNTNQQITTWVYVAFMGLLVLWIGWHYLKKLAAHQKRKNDGGDVFEPL